MSATFSGATFLFQAALVFGIFTLVRTKLPHYTLPAFPALALWLALQRNRQTDSDLHLLRGLTGMALLAILVTPVGFPLVRSQFLASNLWKALGDRVKPNTKMAIVRFGEPSLIWEFRKTITNHIDYISANQAPKFVQGEPPRLLVLPTKLVTPELRAAAINSFLIQARGPGWSTR